MVKLINSVKSGKASVIAAVILVIVGLAALSAWWFSPTNRVMPPNNGESSSVSTSSSTTTETYRPEESVVSAGSYEELISAVASAQSQGGPVYGGAPFFLGGVKGGPMIPTTTVATATMNQGPSTQPPSEYSQTNVQVPGVDEADIAKNDGEYLYIVGRTYWLLATSGMLRTPMTDVYVVKAYPPQELIIKARIDVEGRVTGLFIYKGKLVIINSSVLQSIVKYYTVKEGGKEVIKPEYEASPATSLLIYNIGNREKPYLISSVRVSGWYYTARMIDGVTYLLTTESVKPIYLKGAIKGVTVPEVNGEAISPQNIYYIKNPYLMPWLRTYINILSFNLSNESFKAKSFLLPYPSRVFVSKSSIYVLSTRWGYLDLTDEVLRKAVIPSLPKNVSTLMLKELNNDSSPLPLRIYRAEEILSKYLKAAGSNETVKLVSNIYAYIQKNLTDKPLETTDVFKIDLIGLSPNLTAHGEIKGKVLDQFAITEERGYFMAATTSTAIKGLKVGEGWGWAPTIGFDYTQVSGVYVLNASDLNPVSELTGLAEGERVYAARYVGNYLYLVTFRRVDPLFAIDLSNPTKPEVVGFVKMPGYSEYLHPYMNKYLIGVGYSADNEGRVKEIKVSLYDVSNPKDIKVISEINITKGWSWSEVTWDHKAFLINPGKGYLAIPVRAYESGVGPTGGLYVINISPQEGLKLLGRLPLQGVIRAAYISNYIYAISPEEVIAASMPSLNVVNLIKLS